MTIPKKSRLAEAVSPITHYPVKRRGERRQLLPNWDAIDWLERESADDCEIYHQSEVIDGLAYTSAYGKLGREFSRPMFQVLEIFASPTWVGGRNITPCQCDRFDQTWNCPDHPEIPWDPKRRRWMKPCTGEQTGCECDPCHERRLTYYTGRFAAGVREREPRGFGLPAGLYDHFVRAVAEVAAQINDTAAVQSGTQSLLEVNGETVQGVDHFTINIEGGRTYDL